VRWCPIRCDSFFADRTVTQYTSYSRLSVRPSVALRVGVGVESCTIVFLGRNFLFTSSDTFAIGCIVQPQHTAKNRTAKISASGVVMDSLVTWPWLFQTRHFGGLILQLYLNVVRNTIVLLSDSYTLLVQFCIDRWPITPMTRAKVQQLFLGRSSFPALVVIDKFPV